MDLSTLGTLVTIVYVLGIFIFQWVTDWYFDAIKSPILDEAYFIAYYWTFKFHKERQEADDINSSHPNE
jgi:hypothetical protein